MYLSIGMRINRNEEVVAQVTDVESISVIVECGSISTHCQHCQPPP